MRRFVLVLGLLVLLAPTASARSVAGDLEVRGDLRLAGDIEVRASAGGLDLVEALQVGEALQLAFAAARGLLVENTREYLGPTRTYVGGEPFSAPERREDLRFDAGRFATMTCAASCKAFLFVLPDATGEIGIEGRIDDAWRVVAEPTGYWVGWAGSGVEGSYRYDVPSGFANLTTGGADATRVRDAVGRAEGALGLLLWNVTADIEHAEGATRIETGTTREPRTGPGGVVTGERSVNRYVVLELEGARFAAPRGAPLLALLDAPRAALKGALDADDAHGSVVVGGARHDLSGERLVVEGALDLALEGAPSGLARLGPAPLALSLDGDASRVAIGGAVVARAASSGALALGAVGAVGAAVVAGWLLARAGAFAPFYMRVEPSRVLDNPNRRAIHDAIRAVPGMGMIEIARATGLAEIVARHHVRMLVSHRMVETRSRGRFKGFYALDGSVDPRLGEAALALKDETRRAIALCILEKGHPVTQRQIVEATGLAQRLVSYHLSALSSDGLVAVAEGRPKRYTPSPRLGAVLALPVASPHARA